MRSFRAAVFLDRDGTVIEERHYLATPDGVVLLPGAAQAIARLNRADVAVILVTNQSGVARGYFGEDAVHAVHARVSAELAEVGASFDGLYFCPHLENALLEPYRQACRCRKPAPGMVEQAREHLGLDDIPLFVVGDKEVDLDLGVAVGATSILVRTGYGARVESKLSAEAALPPKVCDGLSDAIAWILETLEHVPSGVVPEPVCST